MHTRFGRTRATAEIALGGRPVPLEEEPLLDDIDVGELEGQTIDDYRAWKAEHTRQDAFPGGESLDDAARGTPTPTSACSRARSGGSSSSATRSPSATRSTPPPARTSSTARRTRSATASRTSSTVAVGLTAKGETEAAGLAVQLAGIQLDLCVHTRFGRTRATAAIALAGREVPLEVEPLFDDIDVGELEGRTIDDYRAWKREHTRADAFPGGESLDDAARRYATAYERLLARPEQRILVVCHEIPVRYAINAAAGSDELDGPVHEIGNCVAHLFDEDGLARAVERIRLLAG